MHVFFSGETRQNVAACPVLGQYTGIIPDATELCARLVSDCNDPQHMHYTVAACFNTSEVYEGKFHSTIDRKIFKIID